MKNFSDSVDERRECSIAQNGRALQEQATCLLSSKQEGQNSPRMMAPAPVPDKINAAANHDEHRLSTILPEAATLAFGLGVTIWGARFRLPSRSLLPKLGEVVEEAGSIIFRGQSGRNYKVLQGLRHQVETELPNSNALLTVRDDSTIKLVSQVSELTGQKISTVFRFNESALSGLTPLSLSRYDRALPLGQRTTFFGDVRQVQEGGLARRMWQFNEKGNVVSMKNDRSLRLHFSDGPAQAGTLSNFDRARAHLPPDTEFLSHLKDRSISTSVKQDGRNITDAVNGKKFLSIPPQTDLMHPPNSNLFSKEELDEMKAAFKDTEKYKINKR